MKYSVGQASQPAQGGTVVQVAKQRLDAALAQRCTPGGGGGEGQHAHMPWQRCGSTQADIAAADDQNPLAAKAGRQRAKGT